MKASPSVSDEVRYLVTPLGRADLQRLALCQCQPKLRGVWFQCDECGTVFGSVTELDRPRRYFNTRGR